jgi:hypothetical protein
LFHSTRTRRIRRRLAAVALAACAFLAFSGVAQAASDGKLLRKFQPVTQFAAGEHFRPTTIETFIADSTLEALDLSSGAWSVADADPSAAALPGPGTGIWRLNQQPCFAAAGTAGLACYAAAWGVHSEPSVVYGRVLRTERRTVLQYWYFYYDNFYSYQNPPSDFIWQAHEGDWEVVNVVLAADGEPRHVGYSQHCLGERRAWAKTPRWQGHHPVVYVARGSHANYFAPGTHEIDPRCVPPAALAILDQLGLPRPVDYTGGGALAGPAALVQETTSIARVRDGSPSWVAFPGFWGELQYLKAPVPLPSSPTGIVPLGTSPVGPAYQATWQTPFETLATWPRG